MDKTISLELTHQEFQEFYTMVGYVINQISALPTDAPDRKRLPLLKSIESKCDDIEIASMEGNTDV